MKSYLYHMQLNIDSAHKDFYKKMMEFMGWTILHEEVDAVGYKSGKTGDIWFYYSPKNVAGDYDARGTNHIALRVENQQDVDELRKYLEGEGIKMLFETPRHRPEFASSEKDTYYQIMFESPDKILFEVVYIGPKEDNKKYYA